MTSLTLSPRQSRWLVFAVALLSHAAYLAVRGPAVVADGLEYQLLARNLRVFGTFSLDEGPPMAPSIRRAPGFPALIAGVGCAGGTIVIQVGLAACVSLWVFLLASRVVPSAIALFTALLYSVHPASLYSAHTLHSETSYCFVSTAGLLVLTIGLERSGIGWLALGGALLGLAALFRPVGAPFLLIGAAAVLVLSPKGARLRSAAIVMLCGLAVMAPWIVRSSFLAHRFVLISAASTANLYVGAQSGQPIYSDAWFQDFIRHDPCGQGVSNARTATEAVRADDVCTRGAFEGIRAKPAAYLGGRAVALRRLLTTSFDLSIANTLTVEQLVQRHRWHILVLKSALLLIFCIGPAIATLFGASRSLHSPAGVLTLAFWLYTIAVYVPGYTEFRYFFPAVGATFVTAACGISALLGRYGAEQTEL